MANLFKLFKIIKSCYKNFKESESEDDFLRLDSAVEEFLLQFDHYVDFVIKVYKDEYKLPVLEKWYNLTTCLEFEDMEIIPNLNAILKQFDNYNESTQSIFSDIDYVILNNVKLEEHISGNCFGCNKDSLVQGGYCEDCKCWDEEIRNNLKKLNNLDNFDFSSDDETSVEPPSEIDIIN